MDTEPVAAPEKKEPPTIVCPREQPAQDGPVTVETDPERIAALASKPEMAMKKDDSEPVLVTVNVATSNSFYPWLTPELNKLLPRKSVLWKVQTNYAKKEFNQDFVYIRVANHITPSEEKRVGRLLFLGRVWIQIPGDPVCVPDNDPLLSGSNVIWPDDERVEHVFPLQMDLLAFRGNFPRIQQAIDSSDNSLHIKELLDDIKTMCLRWDLPLRTEETDSVGELFDHMAVDFVGKHPGMDFDKTFGKVISDRLDIEYSAKCGNSADKQEAEVIEQIFKPVPWTMPGNLETRIGAKYTDGLPRFNILWKVKNDYTRRRYTAGYAYLIIAVNLSPSEMLRMANYLKLELAGKIEGELAVVDAGGMNIYGLLYGAR